MRHGSIVVKSGVKSVMGVFAVLFLLVVIASPLEAQRGGRGAAAEPVRPAPRWPDGQIRLDAPEGATGIWYGPGGPVPGLADRDDNANPHPYPGRPKLSEVPFLPWARAIYDYRDVNQFEPHARCKPSGGIRQFVTPYGNEIVEIRELERVYIFDVGGPHTFRLIFTDGREHPEDIAPSAYGHSIGWWEGDTLVVDTIGFNEKFWLDRRVAAHTSQLHLVERFKRTSYDRIEYEVTIEDPGAYSRPWTTGVYLRWQDDQEMFEYICQEQNQAFDLMVGTQSESFFGNSRVAP